VQGAVPRYDLVVVDLDGTLVDSEALLVGLVNQILVACAHAAAPPRTIAAAIGLPLDEVFRLAAPSADDRAIARLCSAYRRQADALDFVRQFRLFEDVAATLAQLHAGGTRLVVATSKGRATTLDILAHCAIAQHIDAVIGGDSVSRGKPHPEMVERARQLFSTPPERTIVVGDTSFDITMGKAAGVATCAVTYGTQPRDALRALRPDFIIERFALLHPLVARRPRLPTRGLQDCSSAQPAEDSDDKAL
jgi:HAD superfamily hydrolase (TIGR01549 family)